MMITSRRLVSVVTVAASGAHAVKLKSSPDNIELAELQDGGSGEILAQPNPGPAERESASTLAELCGDLRNKVEEDNGELDAAIQNMKKAGAFFGKWKGELKYPDGILRSGEFITAEESGEHCHHQAAQAQSDPRREEFELFWLTKRCIEVSNLSHAWRRNDATVEWALLKFGGSWRIVKRNVTNDALRRQQRKMGKAMFGGIGAAASFSMLAIVPPLAPIVVGVAGALCTVPVAAMAATTLTKTAWKRISSPDDVNHLQKWEQMHTYKNARKGADDVVSFTETAKPRNATAIPGYHDVLGFKVEISSTVSANIREKAAEIAEEVQRQLAASKQSQQRLQQTHPESSS